MNLQEKVVSGDGESDWFKTFAADALTRCVGMTRDQALVYLIGLLLQGVGDAPQDAALWRRKLRAYTGLTPGRLELALNRVDEMAKGVSSDVNVAPRV